MVKQKLFLHIGMPKTGTTSFQASMMQASPMLERAGLLYPRDLAPTGETAHHRFFVGMLDQEHRQHVRSPIRGGMIAFEDATRSILEWKNANPEGNVLLSSEMVWNRKAFDKSVLTRIRNAFIDFDVQVLAVLRAIPDQAISGYSQLVVGPQRYSGTFEDHVQEDMERGVWDYADRLADFASVFGKHAVSASWYDGAAASSYPAFMPRLGLAPSTHAELPESGRRLNRSPAWPTISDQLSVNRMRERSRVLGRLARMEFRWGRTRFLIGSVRPDPRSSIAMALLAQLQKEQERLIRNAGFDSEYIHAPCEPAQGDDYASSDGRAFRAQRPASAQSA